MVGGIDNPFVGFWKNVLHRVLVKKCFIWICLKFTDGVASTFILRHLHYRMATGDVSLCVFFVNPIRSVFISYTLLLSPATIKYYCWLMVPVSLVDYEFQKMQSTPISNRVPVLPCKQHLPLEMRGWLPTDSCFLSALFCKFAPTFSFMFYWFIWPITAHLLCTYFL